MRYSGIIKNDITAAPGISLTFFTQGCPHRCFNCHNPETWDYQGGLEFTHETMNEIIDGLTANGIKRNFCIMGGEPLCAENLFLTALVIETAKERIPDLKIYLWTGYIYDNLKKTENAHLKNILSKIDCLIDGPYIDDLRDLTLQMRGSSNQKIIYFNRD